MSTALPKSARPVWAEIDLAALQGNARAMRARLTPPTEIMAVLKANAYGHGMERIAQALGPVGITRFGVASLEEALRLRAAGITGDILILGYSDPACAAEIIAHSLIQTVGHPEHVRALRDAARTVGIPARVHVKIDTGMTRLGAQESQAQEVLYQAMSHPEVSCRGIFTHFHSADVPEQLATIAQWNELMRLLTPMKKVLGNVEIHAANSAATLNYPETHGAFVRLGISLYGGYPSTRVPRSVPLKPVLQLKSRLVAVKQIS
ncbi:MAG: alanine racemase, partial [bacterium]